MPEVVECPDGVRLRGLVRGENGSEEAEQFALHLEACPSCAAAMDREAAGDALLGMMRRLEADVTRPEEGTTAALITQLLSGTPSGGGSAGQPERLGPYRLLGVLGRGGFGTVFRAYDETLQRPVAVKVLAPELAASSPARQRFLREARAAAQVRHEYVAQIYAVEERPIPYLVMEFVPGGTLQQRLDRAGPLPATEVAAVGRQVAEGLAAAHAAGLIHRDVKPANILVESGPRLHVKITDFGLARAADDASLTQSGAVTGTPLYMSPEQARGERLGPRTDLFSLGSVLYALAAGRPPFRANNTLAVLKRVVEEEPRPIAEVQPETPPDLCRVIKALHAKDPADRVPTANEAADRLAECEQRLKSSGPTRGGVVSRPPSRRATRVAAAALLLVAVPLGVWLGRPGNGPGQADPSGGAAVQQSPPAPTPNAVPTDSPLASRRGAEPPPADSPFGATKAQQLQKAWGRYLGVPEQFTNGVGMTFRLIPPGAFTMGTSPEEAEAVVSQVPSWAHESVRSESPARRLRISDPFYLATTPVTLGQFRKFAAATGHKTEAEASDEGGFMWTGEKNEQSPEFTWRYQEAARSDSHPVDEICPRDALAFCRWLKESDGVAYDLPSEEKWEFGCRAGTLTPWSWGAARSDVERHGLDGLAGKWILEFRGRPTGRGPANAFGLTDVHGNCTEVCRTRNGGYVGRGGKGGCDVWLARSAVRIGLWSETAPGSAQGFRVAITGDLSRVAEGGRPSP